MFYKIIVLLFLSMTAVGPLIGSLSLYSFNILIKSKTFGELDIIQFLKASALFNRKPV